MATSCAWNMTALRLTPSGHVIAPLVFMFAGYLNRAQTSYEHCEECWMTAEDWQNSFLRNMNMEPASWMGCN